METPGTTVLEARGIDKAFGPTQALSGAGLTLRAGEVHVLLGENGAGKSTLIKVLVAAHGADAGQVKLDGEPLELDGVSDAVARGVVPVYQQLTVLSHLTVAENLAAFDIAAGSGWRRTPIDEEAVRRGLELVGLDVEPDEMVGELSLAQRQLLEIARAVLRECRVLILDEPTTSLNRAEVNHLFEVIGRICRAGGAVLFISHRLAEVAEVADRVTVLRNGRTVLDGVAAEKVSPEAIVAAMVGEEVELPDLEQGARGELVLELTAASIEPGGPEIDLRVHRGEIVGLVGLVGSGALPLAEGVAGLRRIGGALRLAGEPLPLGDRCGALRAGVALIPGDRDKQGIFETLSVLQNSTASALRDLARRAILRSGDERERLVPRLRELSVRPGDPDVPITELSGGNQQKVLVARALANDQRELLVAIEPTRGVDISARHDIHRAMVEAARDGIGILLASTDLDEVVGLCHRILVMRGDEVTAELTPDVGVAGVLAELTGVEEGALR